MSKEVLRIVNNLDVSSLEMQLALQCAPVISGLKISNLLSVKKEYVNKLRNLIKGTSLSMYVLLIKENKVSILLYRKKDMMIYLKDSKVKKLLKQFGYYENNIYMLLKKLSLRYEYYKREKGEFPHEIGLFLGYPLEDVIGFINNNGKNSLYTGYWKVYKNVDEKKALFSKYEQIKELMIILISYNLEIGEIIDMIMNIKLRRAVV